MHRRTPTRAALVALVATALTVPVAGLTAAPAAAASWTASTATTQVGVDVSEYQHPNGAPIDWKQVAASGQTFAIVKATSFKPGSNGQPVLFTNPYLHQDLDGASAAGLVIGSYTYARPQFSAVAQADAFANAMGVLPAGSLPPVLDLEDNGGLTPAQLIVWTRAFLNRLAADTGIIPMIYSGPNFWKNSMAGTTEFSNYPLWEAHYTTAAEPFQMGGWGTYTFWQFTSSSSIPGVPSARVDQSRFQGSRSALRAVAQANLPSSMSVGATLSAGQALRSPNRQYLLAMQGDGNLVVYGNGHRRALWSTRTSGHSGAYLALQPDGNAVLYSQDRQALWNSRTSWAGPGGVLVMQDNGDLVLRTSKGLAWHNGAPGGDRLYVGGQLLARQYLHTQYGTDRLVMLGDGNLVLTVGGKVRWSTRTSGHSGAKLWQQSDGNLVVRDTSGRALWASGTRGTGSSNRLVVRATHDVVLLSGNRVVWIARAS